MRLENNLLFKRLMRMKEHPGLWLGQHSLELLNSNVNGYIDAMCDCGHHDSVQWYTEFRNYVADACAGGNRVMGIVHAIRECGYDDHNGVDAYFDLLENFVIAFPTKQEPAVELPPEEIRVIRFDSSAAISLLNEYISENPTRFFGVLSNDGCTQNLQLAQDFKVLTCALYRNGITKWVDFATNIEIQQIPVCEDAEKIKYYVLNVIP